MVCIFLSAVLRRDIDSDMIYRLLEFAPVYFDLTSFPGGEAKRILQRVAAKKAGKSGRVDEEAGPVKKKQKKKGNA